MHAVLIMLFSKFSLNLKGGICGGFIKVKTEVRITVSLMPTTKNRLFLQPSPICIAKS